MHTDEPQDSPLTPRIAVLRGALAARHAPPDVEKALMAAFAQQNPKRRWYHSVLRTRWGMAGGLGGAAVMVTMFMLSLQAPPQVADGAEALAGFGHGADFIALEPLERIKREPNQRIVEAEITRTALASLGMPVTPENAGDRVRAELLIGASGQPLALRLSTLQ